jgi:antitoxin ParD1/3/4
MVITLTREQESWLGARVAMGDFPTIEEAARRLIDERIAELGEFADDDFAWAKPYVDEAREAVARGEVMTLEEHRARVAEHLRALFKP